MQATHTAQLADQELIDLYLNGNEKAFEILLRRHKARIYTSIYIFCKDSQLAEDIFQEVFIKIINTLRSGRYNHEGKFLQWALRIAHNLCVDYFRRDKRRPTVGQTDEYDILMSLAYRMKVLNKVLCGVRSTNASVIWLILCPMNNVKSLFCVTTPI